jgi:hypothetical protein
MELVMKYTFVLMCLLLSLVLGGCSNQAPAEPQYSVTPEPGGQPAFTQPTIVVNVQPEGSDSGAYPAPATTDSTAYPGPATTDSTGYPGPQPTQSGSADGRAQTALEAYQLALETSKKNFGPDAELYAIAPSSIMIGNLGGVPVLPGWFYKFKNAGSRREYIVQIVDARVSGTTTAESIQDPTPKELAIDMSQVKIDSTQVLEQFKAYAAEKNIPTEGVTFDLELVNLEGAGGPTWSVVDPNQRLWLYTVSAANGNVVANPRG